MKTLEYLQQELLESQQECDFLKQKLVNIEMLLTLEKSLTKTLNKTLEWEKERGRQEADGLRQTLGNQFAKIKELEKALDEEIALYEADR